MNNDYSPDLITLLDEDNREHTFEILDTYEYDGSLYYALMPVYENKGDMLNDSGEYTILEVLEDDGEQQLAEVEDEELRRELSAIFEERFNDSFYA
jgi:uncharacterized protein YrzB (UPF0473 family)